MEVEMETTRLWLQTVALLMIGIAACTYTIPALISPAYADDGPPVCRAVDSGKLRWSNATADVAEKAVAQLAAAGPNRRAIVIPVGRSGTSSGGTYGVLCTW